MVESWAEKLRTLTRSSIEDLKKLKKLKNLKNLKNLIKSPDPRSLISIKIFHKWDGSGKVQDKIEWLTYENMGIKCVVYFNQLLSRPAGESWSKYFFQAFFHILSSFQSITKKLINKMKTSFSAIGSRIPRAGQPP